MSILQRIFTVTIVTRQAAAAFALITFVVALPLNTGSYDFTFSVDIFVLLLAVFVSFKIARVRIVSVDPVGARSVGEAAPPPTASSKDP